jgi:hypothetical protein
MSQYVFLDIDGVLNAESDYVSPKGKRIRGPMCGCYCGIGSPHLRELAKLVKATGAETILISSWKDLAEHDPCKIYMKRRFLRFGIRIAGNTSEDETAIGSFDFRGAAIKRWLIRNEASPKFARFVILDDDPFDYRAEKLTGHWVRTSFHGHGFGPDEEKEAERMLRESPND